MYEKIRWEEYAWDQVADGIRRKVFHGEKISVVLVEIAAGKQIEPHTHVHEQITNIFEGAGTFLVDGEPVSAGPGDMLHFAPDQPHGVTVGDAPLLLTDTFTPCRDEFAASKKA